MGFLERDQAAGELEEREVVLGFLRPADQEGAVAVEPGVAGFDDPAARSPAGHVSFQPQFFTARTDVRAVVAGDNELADAPEVVASVEAQPLRAPRCRLWSRYRDRVERRGQQLHVVAVGTVMRQPDRDPSCLAQKRTFRPLLALSVGFGPVFGPPSGAFPIAPSAASQAQSIPTILS